MDKQLTNALSLGICAVELQAHSDILALSASSIEVDDERTGHFQLECIQPHSFELLRNELNIQKEQYCKSISEELKNKGQLAASGSYFFLTEDELFMVKSIKKNEMKCLLKILPQYKQYLLDQNKESLLCRFLGAYRLKMAGKLSIDFVVMRNTMKIESTQSVKDLFDLKADGLLLHRDNKDNVRYKKDGTKATFTQQVTAQLKKAISKDVQFLQSIEVNDYSLLFGIVKQQNGDEEYKLTVIDVLSEYSKIRWLLSFIPGVVHLFPRFVSPERYANLFWKAINNTIFS